MDSIKRIDRLFVGSVEKALLVLEAFDVTRRDLGITDIVARTGLGKSAAQRYVHTLLKLGYLDKDMSSHRYMLTEKVLGIANNFLRVNSFINQAIPYVVDLRKKVEARIGLACPHGDKMMYLLPLQSNNAGFQTANAGHTVPIHCSTSGRVYLSSLEDNEAREVLQSIDLVRMTRETIVDPERIMEEVRLVRETGFCLTDQEITMSDINLAVPLVNGDDSLAGALVFAFNRQRWTRSQLIHDVVPIAMETAKKIMPT